MLQNGVASCEHFCLRSLVSFERREESLFIHKKVDGKNKRKQYPLQREVIHLTSRQINYFYWRAKQNKIALVARPGFGPTGLGTVVRTVNGVAGVSVGSRSRTSPGSGWDLLCLAKAHDSAKVFPHVSHSNCFSSGWDLFMCLVRAPESEKVLSQASQAKGFSFSPCLTKVSQVSLSKNDSGFPFFFFSWCLFSWRLFWLEVVNFLGQREQEKGFSPVWIRMCSCKLPFWTKLLSQWGQLNCLSPAMGKKVKYEQPSKNNRNYIKFPCLRVEMHQKSKHYGLSQKLVVRIAYAFQAFLDIFLTLVSGFVGNLRFLEILPWVLGKFLRFFIFTWF